MTFQGYDITQKDIRLLIENKILFESINENYIPILEYLEKNPKYTSHIMQSLGYQLGKMTKMKFNHGDLIPEHIYYNVQTNTISFIIPQMPIAYDYDEKIKTLEFIFKEVFLDMKEYFKYHEKEIFEGFKVGYKLKVTEIKKKLH